MGAHMLMSIGGLILVSTFFLAANGLLVDNTKLAEENEYTISAIAIAQSVIDEAKAKAFDENTLAGPVTSRGAMSATGSVGRDGSAEAVPVPDTLWAGAFRSASSFDDVDDYHGYRRIVNTPRAEGYAVAVTVRYASETCPDSLRSTPTYCKTMRVAVSSRYFPGQISMSYAFTY